MTSAPLGAGIARCGRRLGICRPRDLDDLETVRAELLQDVRLVHFAALDQLLEADVEWLVRLQTAVGGEIVEAGQMPACEEVREIAGSESRVSVDDLHGRPTILRHLWGIDGCRDRIGQRPRSER